MRVLVVGAGIGGLAAAAALVKAGCAVEVFEQAPEIREVGAGLTVQCNAVRALREIGLDAGLEAIGRRVTETRLLHWKGRVLSRVPFEAIEREMGAPVYGIHRAAVQSYLLEAAGRERVRLGARCTGYAITSPGVDLVLANGERAQGDVLVGADGIHSRVRAQLLGDEPPRYSGYTCWRGLADRADDFFGGGLAVEIWGPGARFGGLGLGDGRLYWYATVNSPQGGRDEGSPRVALLERFREWAAPVPACIEATPDERILRNDIIDRPPTDRWGEGPVTLLGDAAHSMTPNLGQGACQAIEDAVILAHCLRRAPDAAAGLRRYEDARRDRTRRVVVTAWRFGRLGQVENRVARGLRDLLVLATPDRVTRRNVGWAQRFPGLPEMK